jgi:P-type Ca2+ transporter type 2C
VLVIAGVVGLPQPLAPLQLLWMNLVNDTFPAFALAVEPPDADVMTRPPRDPRAELLSAPFLRSVAIYAVLITAVTLAAFVLTLRGGHAERASTVAFVTLAVAQAFHLGNARIGRAVLTRAAALRNRWAVAALLGVLALQVAAVHVGPIARVLGVIPLGAREWTTAVALAAVPAVYGQLVRLWQARAGRSSAASG